MKLLPLKWGVPILQREVAPFLDLLLLLQAQTPPPFFRTCTTSCLRLSLQVPLSRRDDGGHGLLYLFSPSLFFPRLSHSAFRLLDCQSLSYPVIVLVSLPFLTTHGAQNPNSPFISLPSFWGVDGRDCNYGGKVGGTSIKRKPPSWIEFCLVLSPSCFCHGLQ